MAVLIAKSAGREQTEVDAQCDQPLASCRDHASDSGPAPGPYLLGLAP